MGNLITWSERRFTVNVRTWRGNLIRIEVKDSDTVEILKSRIQEREGTPPDQMRLIFCEKALEDNSKCLSDYGIQQESLINMILKLRGGGDDMGDKNRSMEELTDF